MVLNTPIQSRFIQYSDSETIREKFAEYEETFIVLHPFLKIKEGQLITFKYPNWPNKNEIYDKTVPVSWSEVIEKANLKDIKELDALLAYLHCGRREADRRAWLKFMRYVKKSKLIIPQVDDYPSVLLNPTFDLLISLGYQNILLYTDIDDSQVARNVTELLLSEDRLPANARILTPDNKVLITTDFDDRFSYLSSDRETLKLIIDKLDLEGFYCNSSTKPGWSYSLLTGGKIDWDSPERTDY